MRREYSISAIEINSLIFMKLIIDPHVDKHSDQINDFLILELIATLNGLEHIPFKRCKGYQYFITIIDFNGSIYKMIWLLELESMYIGVITAFKDRRYK